MSNTRSKVCKVGGSRVKRSRRLGPQTTVMSIDDTDGVKLVKVEKFKILERCRRMFSKKDKIRNYTYRNWVVFIKTEGESKNLLSIGITGSKAIVYHKDLIPMKMEDYHIWVKEQEDILTAKLTDESRKTGGWFDDIDQEDFDLEEEKYDDMISEADKRYSESHPVENEELIDSEPIEFEEICSEETLSTEKRIPNDPTPEEKEKLVEMMKHLTSS